MLRSIRPLLAVCALALLAPASAIAQSAPPTLLDGDPLNIWTDAGGSIQVNVDGYPASEWYPPTGGFDPATGQSTPSEVARNGFGLIVEPTGSSPRFFGNWIGTVPAPDAGPILTPGNPATLRTTWTYRDFDDTPLVRATQLLAYKNGDRQFDSTYAIENISGRRLTFRANVGGDLAIRGSDSGVGILNAGPPRFVGGVNQEVGAAGGFVESTPWSAYEVNDLSTVRTHAGDAGRGFDNSIVQTPVDNAVGVQWDNHYSPGTELGPGETATFAVGWRFYDTLALTPPTATRKVGELHTLTANVYDQNGNPVDQQSVGYQIEGANPQDGSLSTGNDGTVKIEYVGGAPGTDVVTAYVDANRNKQLDADETRTTANVTWEGTLPPPEIGESANAEVVKGTVKIKLPKGTSAGKAKQLGLRGAQNRFVRLTDPTQIPLGSTLDTKRGTLQLLTAGSRPDQQSQRSTYQAGRFNGGQFLVTQGRKNPLVEMSMRGGKLGGCKTAVPKGGAAAARKRRLFGRARGRFRTRGRHSSATVRGTTWSMTDTCRGTLTVVSRGTVIVRDYSLRKNKTVKAGKRYFAKARKLKKSRRQRLR